LQLQEPVIARRLRRPPPLWFVTNGEATVGPVKTDLLQRGVIHRRIPEDCLVRELTWRTWRPLHEIREVRAVQDGFRPVLTRSHAELVERLSRAQDAAEVLSLALHECVELTGASFGLVHRAISSRRVAVTTCVRGLGMTRFLGADLRDDSAVDYARAGGIVVASPSAGNVERCIGERFGAPPDLGGVAMLPVSIGRELLAIIELGRVGHAFRASDTALLEKVAAAAALVLYGY